MYRSIKAANWLIAAILVAVPFYAFLTVWGSTFVGHFTLLRLWPDILLALLFIATIVCLVLDTKTRHMLLGHQLFRLVAAFVLLALVLSLVGYLRGDVSKKALAYGLDVDLRFLLWFVCVWAAALRSDWLKNHWQQVFLWPAIAVSVFALLQFFVLPNNFLAHFGYVAGKTYVPFITINQNTTTMRAQSFLRGANELGGYAAILVAAAATAAFYFKKSYKYAVLVLLFALALFVSFSRSAWIGAVLSVLAVFYLRLNKYGKKLILIATLALLLAGIGLGVLTTKNSSVANDVLHVNDHSTATVTSNQGHVMALKDSLREIVKYPLGSGAGTSGPASWYNDTGKIQDTESFFLQITEETGVEGLFLFAAIILVMLLSFWHERKLALALIMFSAVLGAIAVNLFSFGWDDPTIAYVWWGLAGIAMAVKAKNHGKV